LIPYHLAEILTFPKYVLQHFCNGCFSASISGKDMFSVALDEGHEMEINLKSENALNSFSQSYLATLTYYLPFRAKTLHNFKLELNLEREEGMYNRESTRSYIKTAEITVCEYIHNLQSSSLFVSESNKNLHHILTKTETNTEQTDSLTYYRQYGEEDMQNYLKCFLLKTSGSLEKTPRRKRRKPKTFALDKVTVHKKYKKRD
jgi:hypothetical protein